MITASSASSFVTCRRTTQENQFVHFARPHRSLTTTARDLPSSFAGRKPGHERSRHHPLPARSVYARKRPSRARLGKPILGSGVLLNTRRGEINAAAPLAAMLSQWSIHERPSRRKFPRFPPLHLS